MSTKNILILSNEKKRYEVHVETRSVVLRDVTANRYLRIRRGRNKVLKYIQDGCALSFCESMFARLLAEESGSEESVIRPRRWYDEIIVQCDGSALRRLVVPSKIFAIPAILFGILVSTIGAIDQMTHLMTNEIPIWISTVWLLVNIIFHEVGHALCCIACEREVSSFGIKLNYGIPMVYVGTSDICMAACIDRIRTSLAGVYLNGILLLGLVLAQGTQKAIFGNLGLISLAIIGLNLMPFVKLDGYYVLEDLIDEPGLAKSGLYEVYKFFRRKKEEYNKIILVYGFSELVFFVLIGCLIISQFIRLLNIKIQ